MGDKIKKLSQAIRLGATFRPQCWFRYFDTERALTEPRFHTTSCALGAAYEAITGETESGDDDKIRSELEKRFPEAAGCMMMQVTIWNDKQGLTREQIADRLEAQGL